MSPKNNIERRSKSVMVMSLLAGLLIADPASAMEDETKHFTASAVCGAGAETFLNYKTDLPAFKRIPLATLIGLLPGLAKELIDEGEEDNSFSGSDLGADALGSFSGACVSSLFNSVVTIDLGSKDDRHFKIMFNWDF